jgi:hypothetical protein
MSEGARGRRALRAALAVGGTALLLALAWRRVDGAALRALLSEARWGWVALAAALVPLQVGLAGARWSRVSGALGQPLAPSRAIPEYALSTGLNQVLPGGIAGDAVRVWRQRRAGAPLGAAVRGAVVERWCGQALLAVSTLAGLAAWPVLLPECARPASLVGTVGAVSLAVLAVAALPEAVPALGPLARDARRALSADGPRLLALTLPLHLSLLAGFQACAVAIGRPLGAELWVALPMVLTLMAVPLAVGGWGPRELGAVGLLPLFGWAETDAFALAALFGLATLAGALPGLLVPLLSLRGPAHVG